MLRFGKRFAHLCVCLLAALSACAGPADDAPADPAPAGSFGLPAPAALTPARQAEFADADGYLLGAQFDPSLPSQLVTAAGDAALFAPNFDPAGSGFTDTAYAIYVLHLPDSNGTPGRLGLSWQGAGALPAEHCFCGLANFTANQWNFFATADGAGFELPALSPDYIDGSDTLLLAVILTGTASATLESLQLVENHAPLAVLTATPDSGAPPLLVTLDGSGSTAGDPAEALTEYAWDFNGDGLFDASGTTASVQHEYAAVGPYTATLRVTDAAGLVNTASVAIQVVAAPTGVPQTLDEAGDVGRYSSLALVRGRPAIAYYDQTNNDLRYIRAKDLAAAEWNAPVVVDSAGFTGLYPSLAVVADSPAISYSGHNGELRFVRAADSVGASWSAPVPVADVSDYDTTLAVIGAVPAIVYQQGSELWYAGSLDAEGAQWAAPVFINAGPDGAVNTLGLLELDGRPAITFGDGAGLQFVHALDAGGASWAAALTLDATAHAGLMHSTAIIGGVPTVAYATESELRLVRALGASGASWSTPLTLDSGDHVGWYPALGTTASGLPLICYRGGDALVCLRGLDALGGSWEAEPTVLDDTGVTGWHGSLTIVGGYPALSYFRFDAADLRFLRFAP